MIMDYKWC